MGFCSRSADKRRADRASNVRLLPAPWLEPEASAAGHHRCHPQAGLRGWCSVWLWRSLRLGVYWIRTRPRSSRG